jgi:hypothetical protein
MCLEPSLHFLETNGFLFPALSNDGEIVQVFEELAILSNGKYNRRLSPPFIHQELLLG